MSEHRSAPIADVVFPSDSGHSEADAHGGNAPREDVVIYDCRLSKLLTRGISDPGMLAWLGRRLDPAGNSPPLQPG